MVEYSKVNIKLPDSKLNKLKSAVKNQSGVILRMNTEMIEKNNLSLELLLTTRQKTK